MEDFLSKAETITYVIDAGTKRERVYRYRVRNVVKVNTVDEFSPRVRGWSRTRSRSPREAPAAATRTAHVERHLQMSAESCDGFGTEAGRNCIGPARSPCATPGSRSPSSSGRRRARSRRRRRAPRCAYCGSQLIQTIEPPGGSHVLVIPSHGQHADIHTGPLARGSRTTARSAAANRCMVRTASLVALAGFAAGCGEDATRDAAAVKAQPVKVDLRTVPDAGGRGAPGFDPIDGPRTEHGAQSLAGEFSAGEVERLRRAGFSSITFQPLSGDDGSAGVTIVQLFKSAEGARDWLRYETSDAGIEQAIPGAKPRRFTVRGVPGARGWTGKDRHGNPIGHVYWVQGRCEMVIGNEGEGDYVELLSTGAKAIYQRTRGRCP